MLSLDYLDKLKALADSRGLAVHLDGARMFNAATALNVPVARITSCVTTVQFCLSKVGLCITLSCSRCHAAGCAGVCCRRLQMTAPFHFGTSQAMQPLAWQQLEGGFACCINAQICSDPGLHAWFQHVSKKHVLHPAQASAACWQLCRQSASMQTAVEGLHGLTCTKVNRFLNVLCNGLGSGCSGGQHSGRPCGHHCQGAQAAQDAGRGHAPGWRSGCPR